MVVLVTPGQQHEATMFEPLMEQGEVKRRGRGRPRIRPRRIVGDKGYSSRPIRRFNEHRRGPFDKAIYRQRNRVERLIGLMKQHRRLATRYEKRAANYRAMWVIAATIHWLQFADTP